MTVRELKEILDDCKPDAVVVVRCGKHGDDVVEAKSAIAQGYNPNTRSAAFGSFEEAVSEGVSALVINLEKDK